MLFHCYILRLSNGKFYTGMTGDLKRRMSEHRAGRSRSTRRHLPFEIVWSNYFISRSEARKMEVHIKIAGARRFLLAHFLAQKNFHFIQKYNLT